MAVDDIEEAQTMWRDLHEQFNTSFTAAETEMLDAFKIFTTARSGSSRRND